MSKRRGIAAAAMLAVAMTVPVTTAQADSGGGRAPAGVGRDEGGEYVVAYDTAKADEAMQAIAAAGGTVEEVTSEVGLALVDADAGFADKVTDDAAITGAMINQSIGNVEQGKATVRATQRLTAMDGIQHGQRGGHRPDRGRGKPKGPKTDDPYEALQWDMQMIGATRDAAQKRATGKGVTVGVIDTGVDASHPDISPNFNWSLSRNFVTDIPDIDGPCEDPSCVDPVGTDDGGHGTHVAGTIAAARNGVGIAGVAPDATIVEVRAGQDSGYFFLWETVHALVYAGAARLDVVNMSFYTDPWLFNCASKADYVSGDVTDEQIAEQALTRKALLGAVAYARNHGVTLVAAAGNDHTDYSTPTRSDASSPDYGADPAARVVSSNCLDLPSEAPGVITVGSVGPSGTKAYYSNYGLGTVDVAAPGGSYYDGPGTPAFRTAANLVLSAYPFHVAVEEGLVDADGTPTDDFTYSDCKAPGNCAVWTYLQGTSMASPHVAGLAALVIQTYGRHTWRGSSMDPAQVARIIERSANDHACPAGGTQTYADAGIPASYDAVCNGTTADNALYGEGIVSAVAAVSGRRW